MTPSPRAVAILVAVVLVAVPMSGCLETLNPATWSGDEWVAALSGAEPLQERGLTGSGVKVAVIDTGIDLSHPEFEGIKVLWADLVNGRGQPYDDNGHGTHVAGIMMAQGDWTTLFSGYYLKGIAPDVTLIVIKAISADGTGEETKVAQGVKTAVANGAHVIVLSLGGKTFPVLGTRTEEEVRKAVDAGVFVVAAAGNAQEDEESCSVTSPATVPGVIAVGAVDKSGKLAAFSCRGTDNGRTVLPPSPGRSDPDKKPEVVAPGVDVLSAWKSGQYVKASGTSQAAPVVGGILALVLEAKPELKRQGPATVDRVKEALMTSSQKIGPLAGKSPTTHDNGYGYGLVQGDALLKALS